MATAERRVLAYAPILVIVLGGAAFSWWQWGRTEESAAAPSASIAPLAVTAESAFQFASLDEMLQASDAVVVGVVEATSRGRLVGDPADGGVVSRVVTLRVERSVWAPGGPLSSVVLLEEEGWLPDGTPIEVNGVPASAVGDRGLWFLDQVPADDVSVLLTINSQGRFLDTAAGTVGGDQSDPLVQVVQQRPFDQLVELTISLTKEL